MPRTLDLSVHLARREVASAQRMTLLGWAWPLVRQLSQLAVLVLVFSEFLDVGIDGFAVFVFCGLLVWNWFSSAVPVASTSIVAKRHLALQPGFPTVIIPATAVVVPLIDVLMAFPVFVALAAIEGDLSVTAFALPLVFGLELLLLIGVAWIVAGTSVYLRDIPNTVGVLLTLLFYISPVFYDRSVVPDDYEWVLDVNPIAILIEAARWLVLDDPAPSALQLVWVTAFSAVVCGVGLLLFRRMQGGFPDEL